MYEEASQQWTWNEKPNHEKHLETESNGSPWLISWFFLILIYFMFQWTLSSMNCVTSTFVLFQSLCRINLVRLYRVTSRTAASHPSYRKFLCNMRAIHKYHVIRQKNNFELAALSSSPATSCVLGLRSWYAGLGAVDYHQVSSIWRLVKTCMKYTIWFIVYKFYLKRL